MAGLTEDINERIDNMPPGIKMDYLVAKTMGQAKFEHPGFTRVEDVQLGYTDSRAIYICPLCAILEERQESRNGLCVKFYSTNITCAWEVVNWWLTHNGDLFIEWWQDGEWFLSDTNLISRKEIPAICARSDKIEDHWDSDDLPSFPLAICRMAIKKGLQDGVLTIEDLEMGFEDG